MTRDTRPVFVIGSGRCGTRSIYKMLSGTPGVEIHHEFECTHIQRAAALYAMGKMPRDELKLALTDVYGGALFYSNDPVWIDCSNKASWTIDVLHELFPTARFVVLIRDGRKVVASFFNKLSQEIYDDESVSKLAGWLAAPENVPRPPPEKKYWWNIPQPGQPFAEEFSSFNQFQRICYHWQRCNQEIMTQLRRLSVDSWHTAKLEEISTDVDRLKAAIDFMGLPYDPAYFEALQTPQNVFFPMDFQLNKEQQVLFDEICSPMMQELGYSGTASYVVQY